MATLPIWTSLPHPTDNPKSFARGTYRPPRDLRARDAGGRRTGGTRGTGGGRAGTGGDLRVGRLRA